MEFKIFPAVSVALALLIVTVAPSSFAGLARVIPPSMSDLSVAAGDAISDLNRAKTKMTRAATGCHKRAGDLESFGKDADKELQRLHVTIQRDQNDIDGMTSDLEKTNKDVDPSAGATCEQSVADLRKMYFRVQSTYRQVGQNTVVVMDRLKIIGEKYEKLLQPAQINVKEPKCQDFVAKIKDFQKTYQDAREKTAKLASGYNARAASTGNSIAAIPIGYCKVGAATGSASGISGASAVGVSSVTNVNAATHTVVNANVGTDTVITQNAGTDTVVNGNERTETDTNVNARTETVTTVNGQTETITTVNGQTETVVNTNSGGCSRGLGRPEDCAQTAPPPCTRGLGRVGDCK